MPYRSRGARGAGCGGRLLPAEGEAVSLGEGERREDSCFSSNLSHAPFFPHAATSHRIAVDSAKMPGWFCDTPVT